MTVHVSQGSTSSPNIRGVHLPTGWGSNFLAAIANGKARVGVTGDSVLQGYAASNPDTLSFLGLLTAALKAKWGDGGSGFKSASFSSTFINAGNPAFSTAWASALYSLTGAWINETAALNGPSSYYLGTVTNGSTVTRVVTGTTVKTFTFGGPSSAGNFTYSIDGGAETGAISGVQAAAGPVVTTITGLTAGAHTVVVTASPGATTSYFGGITGENATGVVVDNFARGGADSSYFNNSDAQAAGASWSGGYNYPGDLNIWEAGVNDGFRNLSGDTWAKNTRIWLEAVRNPPSGQGNGASDVLIILPHVGRWDVPTAAGGPGGSAAGNYTYSDISVRALGLAEAYGAALIDFWTIYQNSYNYFASLNGWGSLTSPGSVGTDLVHPGDIGHGLYYNGSGVLPGLKTLFKSAGLL